MVFSAIAGWFVRRFWPMGVIAVALITIASAVIQFVRYEAVNSNRELAGLTAYPNDAAAVLSGAVIDFAINFVIFSIVWGLRRKFKPHLNSDHSPKP